MRSTPVSTPRPRGRTRSQRDHVPHAVDAFRRILRELRIVARKTELATGLSAAQLFVLSSVNAAPGCSVNDIARATMTDRSSVATLVDRLVDEGYLRRERAGADRRRASITVTPRGGRAMGTAAPAPTALLIAGLRTLSAAQLGDLTRGLVALTRGMDIAHEPAAMLFEEPALRGRRRREPSAARR
jgi:DNA-binding MarR family transcriptional regulator